MLPPTSVREAILPDFSFATVLVDGFFISIVNKNKIFVAVEMAPPLLLCSAFYCLTVWDG